MKEGLKFVLMDEFIEQLRASGWELEDDRNLSFEELKRNDEGEWVKFQDRIREDFWQAFQHTMNQYVLARSVVRHDA